MASLCSSADCACMACSWCAADMGGGSPPWRSLGYGVPTDDTRRLISQCLEKWSRSCSWTCLTEHRVPEHLVFVRVLSEQGVGDGSGRVGEPGEVRSAGQRVYKRMCPRTWGTHKTFTTPFSVSAAFCNGTESILYRNTYIYHSQHWHSKWTSCLQNKHATTFNSRDAWHSTVLVIGQYWRL